MPVRIPVSIAGVDLVHGLERYGREAAYLDVIRSYHIHTPGLLEKIKSLAQKGTEAALAEYAVIVHGLKGSSYGICAHTAGREAEELEKAAKAGDIDRVMTENGSFCTMVESLLLDLGRLLEEAAAGRGAKQHASMPDSTLLSSLLEAASQYNAAEMEKIIKELDSCEYESGGGLIDWLRKQMDNLEYDAIREQLEKPDPFNNMP